MSTWTLRAFIVKQTTHGKSTALTSDDELKPDEARALAVALLPSAAEP